MERGETTHEEAEKELREEWPQRTFERDIQTLRDAGVNVESRGRENGAGTIAFRGFSKPKRTTVTMGRLKGTGTGKR